MPPKKLNGKKGGGSSVYEKLLIKYYLTLGNRAKIDVISILP